MSVGAVLQAVGNLRKDNGALQGLENIVLQILGILNTAGNADEVSIDTNSLTSGLWDTSVGHGSWNLAERLNATKRLGKDEEVGGLAEALGSLSSALDAEREHTTSHSVAVLLHGNLAVWVRLKTWVVDGDDVWGGLESLSNCSCVGGGLAGTEMESLETTVGEPAVECGWDSTNSVLEEREASLHGVRVEGSNTHDNIGVSVDVLGDGVDDNVGTVVEWVLDVWRQEGVVNNDHDAVLVSLLGNSTDVDKAEGWVGWSLNPDKLGVLGDVLGDVDLNLWGEGNVNTVRLSNLGEVSVGSTVDIGDGDNVGASSQRLEDHSGGGRTRGECKSILGVLKSCDGLLKVVTVWVGGAGVLVLSNWLANSSLGEGGGEGDGLNNGTGDRVVRRASVDGESAEAVDWRWCAWRSIDWSIALWLSDASWGWINGDSHVGGCVETAVVCRRE